MAHAVKVEQLLHVAKAEAEQKLSVAKVEAERERLDQEQTMRAHKDKLRTVDARSEGSGGGGGV